MGKNHINRFNSNGELLWTKNFIGQGYSIKETQDKGFIVGKDKSIYRATEQGDSVWSIPLKINASNVYQNLDDGFLVSALYMNNVILIRTNEAGNYTGLGILPFKDNVFTVSQPTLIEWISKNINSVNLQYSSDDGISWLDIASNIPDTGSFSWTIPATPTSLGKVKLYKSSDKSVFDVNEKSFSISFNKNVDFIDINQVLMWIGNNGMGSHDPRTEGQGLYWPGGVNATIGAVFQDGLWWGGKINGELKVNGNDHRQGLQSGKILLNGKAGEPIFIWKIRKDWLNLPPGPEKDRYKYNYDNWPGDIGAPFIDVDKDNKFTKGIDQPGFLGDEVMWFAANDLDTLTSRHTFGSDPIGLEIQLTTFGYDKQNDLADVVFKKYKIINKSGKQIDDMYLAYWSDPDLGDASDDYVGCDTLLNLGFCYNADNNDQEFYGAAPPAIGYKIVQGPVSEGNISDSARINNEWRKGEKNLPMTAFVMYIGANTIYKDPSSGIYQGSFEVYNYFQGLGWNGNKFVDPNNTIPTKYTLTGDPVSGIGWYEGKGWPGGFVPDDRRFLMSSGPFNMSPADTQEIVLAIIMARGSDNINSIAELKRKAKFVQEFYDLHMPTTMDDKKSLPIKFELYQNYPNPFNPSTTISYQLPVNSKVTLKIFNTLGQEVKTLVNEYQTTGFHSSLFTLRSSLPSGVYFYQLKTSNFMQTKKMVILK